MHILPGHVLIWLQSVMEYLGVFLLIVAIFCTFCILFTSIMQVQCKFIFCFLKYIYTM